MSCAGNHPHGVAGKGETQWWSDPQEVIAFARVLVDAEQLGACQHLVISFFEQPWAWDREHTIWCASGRPDMVSDARSDSLILRFNGVRAERRACHRAVRWRDWTTA